ncbi:MAG: hypothetical protein PHX40_04770 [Bacilli bacterium]|jgi:hypothetical protein|nr:hypothetical protein [Bacilli bacterium]
MIKKILNILFWVAFVVVFSIWVVDFIKVKSNKDPIFCLKKEVHKYDDGTVKECLGLGYRVYNYDRKSLPKGIDFAPFFIKMREPENN